MKRDEVRAIIPDITDEQLKSLMDINGADVNAEKDAAKSYKAKLDEANEKLKAAMEANEAKDAESKTIEQRMKDIEEQFAQKERELALDRNELEAKKVLSAAGISDDEIASVIGSIVSEDADKTVSGATALAALVTGQKTIAAEAERKKMMSGTTKPQGSSGAPKTVTREQFAKMDYAQMEKLFEENPELFKQLNE